MIQQIMQDRVAGPGSTAAPQTGPDPIKAYMNWSGGKDSALCLHRVLQDPSLRVDSLLTNFSSYLPGTDPWGGPGGDRVAMHGVRRDLVTAQAAAIGIPLETIELPEQPGMPEYEAAMSQKINALKARGCDHALFGDIFLEDLRAYREEKLRSQEIRCLFPLWKVPSRQLMAEFLDLGFKAIVVCVNARWLDRSFCGRMIDASFVRDLPENVDPCGENGEFHSFVFDGPIFRFPVTFEKGKFVYKEHKAPQASEPAAGFYFCDLIHL
jgi:uncharacterized protein (TIGR00290 family)